MWHQRSFRCQRCSSIQTKVGWRNHKNYPFFASKKKSKWVVWAVCELHNLQQNSNYSSVQTSLKSVYYRQICIFSIFFSRTVFLLSLFSRWWGEQCWSWIPWLQWRFATLFARAVLKSKYLRYFLSLVWLFGHLTLQVRTKNLQRWKSVQKDVEFP